MAKEKLTAASIKAAQPKEKTYRLFDGGGLYLEVTPSGGKYWRYKYRFQNKEKRLAIGVFPVISLKDAREMHLIAANLLAEGIDPNVRKKVNALTGDYVNTNTFKGVAEEWFQTRMLEKSQSYQTRTRRILNNDLFPFLGDRVINEITVPELLAVLKKVEARTIDIAHRTKQTAKQVFDYAIQTGRTESNPALYMRGALKTPKTKHLAAITDPKELGKLLVDIDQSTSSIIVRAALKLTPILFQRPGEIRQMEWSEINWEKRIWELPAEKMKMRQPHVVPLSKQAISILQELQPYTRNSKYVFPSARGVSRCISENTVRMALRDLGYQNEDVTPHGFRATARTLLDEELHFRVEWIEQQLAHTVKDINGRAYNRTRYLEDRARMMQAWSDYLDQLRSDHTNRIKSTVKI